MEKWAKLDASGLLLDVTEVRDDAWEHWAGPFDEIDNAPGRFVWDEEAGRFEPLGFGTLKPGGPAPAPEAALYAFLKAAQMRGQPIPPESLQWMEFFKGSLDAQGRGKGGKA